MLFLELKRADYVSTVLFTLCYVLDFAKLLVFLVYVKYFL